MIGGLEPSFNLGWQYYGSSNVASKIFLGGGPWFSTVACPSDPFLALTVILSAYAP